MPAPKRARRTRKSEEFELLKLVARLESLRVQAGAYSWSMTEIQDARDQQMVGDFKQPARLAESFNTDDAMFAAKRTRLAPQKAIPVKIVPPSQSDRARRIANEADGLFGPSGVGATPDTFVSINRILADHGVAFGMNIATPRDDGTRIDFEHHAWPIEWVRWDPMLRCFVTQVDVTSASPEAGNWLDGSYARYLPSNSVPIIHGDGRWSVYAGEEIEPWKSGCVLPGALTWARHAFGFRDWLNSSASHGNSTIVGTMPEGTRTRSQEGDDFLALLVALASADMPVGLLPAGGKVDFLADGSTAWEIFRELVNASRLSANQIYNGHDGLGTNPSGPGYDLKAVLGVVSDIAEGDLHTIERCFKSGVIDPWAAMNFGSSSDAPERLYQIPDRDQDEKRERAGSRRIAFYDAIERERSLGFDVSEERIEALAKEYDVSIGKLAAAGAKKPAIALAPTDLALVVRVDEARASAELDAMGGADGAMPLAAYKAKLEQAAAAPPISGQPGPGAQAPASTTPPTGANGAGAPRPPPSLP